MNKTSQNFQKIKDNKSRVRCCFKKILWQIPLLDFNIKDMEDSHSTNRIDKYDKQDEIAKNYIQILLYFEWNGLE